MSGREYEKEGRQDLYNSHRLADESEGGRAVCRRAEVARERPPQVDRAHGKQHRLAR